MGAEHTAEQFQPETQAWATQPVNTTNRGKERRDCLPTVGVVAALRELVDDIEEVLSARAKGAIGGGLEE